MANRETSPFSSVKAYRKSLVEPVVDQLNPDESAGRIVDSRPHQQMGIIVAAQDLSSRAYDLHVYVARLADTLLDREVLADLTLRNVDEPPSGLATSLYEAQNELQNSKNVLAELAAFFGVKM